MQINLLSIFKYENSFEKSVGYVFVQILDIKLIILVTMMCQWILLEHFFSNIARLSLMQMISRLYIIFLNANTKCTLLFFLYQCSLQGNAACDIVKSNQGNKFIFCLFCCHPVFPTHAVHSVLYLIVKVYMKQEFVCSIFLNEV